MSIRYIAFVAAALVALAPLTQGGAARAQYREAGIMLCLAAPQRCDVGQPDLEIEKLLENGYPCAGAPELCENAQSNFRLIELSKNSQFLSGLAGVYVYGDEWMKPLWNEKLLEYPHLFPLMPELYEYDYFHPPRPP